MHIIGYSYNIVPCIMSMGEWRGGGVGVWEVSGDGKVREVCLPYGLHIAQSR